MEIKKSNIPNNTITRKLTDLDAPTGNIYESVVVISKRANQISSEIKQELNRKLADFSSVNDSLEETFEDRDFQVLRETSQTRDYRDRGISRGKGLFPRKQRGRNAAAGGIAHTSSY